MLAVCALSAGLRHIAPPHSTPPDGNLSLGEEGEEGEEGIEIKL